jgi:hypothetical protein
MTEPPPPQLTEEPKPAYEQDRDVDPMPKDEVPVSGKKLRWPGRRDVGRPMTESEFMPFIAIPSGG